MVGKKSRGREQVESEHRVMYRDRKKGRDCVGEDECGAEAQLLACSQKANVS